MNLDCPGPSGRDDCGHMGIDEAGCTRKGCVWCPITSPGPWCTYGESASTTVSTRTSKPSGGTTSKPSGGGGGSGGCDASVECCQKEEFEQLCPEKVNCNIPDLADREDCGELASTPTTCVASGDVLKAFNRYRRKRPKVDASIFESALSQTRRSDASKKKTE